MMYGLICLYFTASVATQILHTEVSCMQQPQWMLQRHQKKGLAAQRLTDTASVP